MPTWEITAGAGGGASFPRAATRFSTPAMYTVAREENDRKNITLTEIQGILPVVTPDDYIWAYDANRVLQVSINARIPVTPGTKLAMQTALNTRFGSGKVVVN